MHTKIGILSSNRTAIVHSLRSDVSDIKYELSRYSERDLFEMTLMLEYLLLMTTRKQSTNNLWVRRLERQLETIKALFSDERRSNFMKKIGLPTVFAGNQYGKTLLFPWFR